MSGEDPASSIAIEDLPEEIRKLIDIDLNTRAGLVAHLIHLGKPLPVGFPLGFALQFKDADTDLYLADRERAVAEANILTEKLWVHFTVTQEDIDAATALIKSRKITYSEPKTSELWLTDHPANPNPTKK
jgi:hypothetical protein